MALQLDCLAASSEVLLYPSFFACVGGGTLIMLIAVPGFYVDAADPNLGLQILSVSTSIPQTISPAYNLLQNSGLLP